MAITLRFLATKETCRSLRHQCQLSPSSISSIVLEVCDAIIKAIGGEYTRFPSNEEDWRKTAK